MTEEQINALINGLDKQDDTAAPEAEGAEVPSEEKPTRTASMLVRATLSQQQEDDAQEDEIENEETDDDDNARFGPGLVADADAWERANQIDRVSQLRPTEPPADEMPATQEADADDTDDDAFAAEALAPSPEPQDDDVDTDDDGDETQIDQDAAAQDTASEVAAKDADSGDEDETSDSTESHEEAEPVQLRIRSKNVPRRRSEGAPEAKGAKDDRKPRVMIMGEFSAGKSTLMNLLLGEPALPVNATATQLPPVWITKGTDGTDIRVDVDGSEEPVDLSRPETIPLEDTHYIRVQKSADLLDMCDLIDTPGISDPNMPIEVWQRMIQHADAIVWCTHATQAWRQSEAAAWSMLPEKLRNRSLLLLTRFDKITSDRDRVRVIKRVKRETEGLFRDLFPISLTDAIEAGDDRDAFAAAGGESFADALFEVIGLIQRKDASVRTRPRSQLAPFKLEPEPEPVRVVTPRRVKPRPLAARPLTGRRSSALGSTERSL